MQVAVAAERVVVAREPDEKPQERDLLSGSRRK